MRPLDPDLAEAYDSNLRRRRRNRHPSADRERRRLERLPIANTEVHSHSISGRVLDLTRSGMAIESHSALNPGQRYTLTLSIGEYVETLEAEVLWCRLLSTARNVSGEIVPTYRAGIVRAPAPPQTSPDDPVSRDDRESSRPSLRRSGSTPSSGE